MSKVQISNNPLAANGNLREVEVKEILINVVAKKIEFLYTCYTKLNDIEIPQFRKTSTLTADNTTPVNSVDGIYKFGEVINGTTIIGEYDYWFNYIQNKIFNFNEIINVVVNRADNYNRFN